MRKLLTLFLIIITTLLFSDISFASTSEVFSGTVLEVGDNHTYKVVSNDFEKPYIKAKSPEDRSYKMGDRVIYTQLDGNSYVITDHVRTDGILYLFLLFLASVVLVTRGAGITSILGMAYSFFVIFKFLLPQLNMGRNPILITLLTVIFIAPVSFVLSHGVNRKTIIALSSTILSLFITSLLALLFIDVAHITGFGSEEASFLMFTNQNINIQGIFLAGIIIGTLGILDDATVTQASIVSQLKSANKKINDFEIFKRAMKVGHDHIASTVNTLILVYTGASLPLLLLFINTSQGYISVLNTPMVAEEVITMLVSSIGLVLSIPISTLLASIIVVGEEESHPHFH